MRVGPFYRILHIDSCVSIFRARTIATAWPGNGFRKAPTASSSIPTFLGLGDISPWPGTGGTREGKNGGHASFDMAIEWENLGKMSICDLRQMVVQLMLGIQATISKLGLSDEGMLTRDLLAIYIGTHHVPVDLGRWPSGNDKKRHIM